MSALGTWIHSTRRRSDSHPKSTQALKIPKKMLCNTIRMYATVRNLLAVSKTLGIFIFMCDAPNLCTPFDQDRQSCWLLEHDWLSNRRASDGIHASVTLPPQLTRIRRRPCNATTRSLMTGWCSIPRLSMRDECSSFMELQRINRLHETQSQTLESGMNPKKSSFLEKYI